MAPLLVVLMTLLPAEPSAPDEAPLPGSLDFAAIRALPTQHDGRWPPLDTVARDLVEKVTGETHFRGQDPVGVLLAWTFDPATWRRQPLVRIGNAELRAELKLPPDRKVFSYAELVAHHPLMAMMRGLADIGTSRKLDPLESEVNDIGEKLLLLHDAFAGESIRLIPDAKDVGAAWEPIALPAEAAEANAAENDSDPQLAAVRDAWRALRRAFLADDGPAFASATGELSAALSALPAAHRPSPERIQTELLYNRLHPFKTAWIILAIGAVLAAGALAVQRRWCDAVAMVVLIGGFAVLSYGLWLRWQIAGRIPASNMFESLLFLSWGLGLFAILSMFVLRHRLVPFTAAGMAALSLFLADVLPLDSHVRPIVPVLMDTVWMSIHVPIIMVSYSVLAIGVLVAHVQLGVMAIAPERRPLIEAVDALHYTYLHVGSILLFAGVATGSMWAASSWGRYWGWDPKEVWSFVALLGYLTILHVRVDREKTPAWAYAVAGLLAVGLFVLIVPKLAPITPLKILGLVGTGAGMVLLVLGRGPFAMAAKSILCFWLIVMTYVGVNYVLGIGLHSYGFGTGAVAGYLFMIGGADLLLVAALTLAYLSHRAPTTPPPRPSVA